MALSETNPMGLDGFAFVEFASHKPQEVETYLNRMGFEAVAKHKTKRITLFRQNTISFLLNTEPHSFAMARTEQCGPGATGMAFRVADAQKAYTEALKRGALPFSGNKVMDLPAIAGIGGTPVYLVSADKDGDALYEAQGFEWLAGKDHTPKGVGLTYLDHITNNVQRGHMDAWAQFYERIFGFKEIRYFDISGEYTGLHSRAMSAPCPRMAIPINEDKDAGPKAGQIDRYLREMNGTEGMQHFALGSDNIYDTVKGLRANGVDLMPPPPATYYDMVEGRLGDHGEDISALRANGILIDGSQDRRLLLQIFSKEEQGNATDKPLGPAFFEFIQRKGDDGFGEGNFKALFLSIEANEKRNATA